MSWKHEQLVDICEIFSDGDWIESKDQSEDGIRLIQTGNVGLGLFKSRDAKARYINEETYKRLRCTEIKEGDILVSRLPDPIGRSCIIPILDKKSITAVDCTIIRVKKTVVNSNYLNYYFQSPEYFRQVNKSVTGATRQRISRSSLGKVKIPLPSLDTQQKIVAKLDAIFAEINKAVLATETNIKNAEALIQSYLKQLFNSEGDEWETHFIKDLIKMRSGDFLPMKNMSNEGFVDVYGGNGISGKHNIHNLSGENILIGRVGAKCGNVRLVFGDIWVTDNAFYVSDFKKNMNKEFLSMALEFKNLRNMASQMAQPVISFTAIKDVELKLPKSLDKQVEILATKNYLKNQLDIVLNCEIKKVKLLNCLKRSTLKQAFNGELVKD